MSVSPFPQNVIAVIWDFDKTLIPGYMQKPLFARFSVDESVFWQEVQGLAGYYGALGHPLVAGDTIYLSHILSYVRAGKFEGLNNATLREVGEDLEFYPGVPDIMDRLRTLITSSERFKRHEIDVEHYVVSTGLRQIVLGSSVAEKLAGVWACEFLESTAPPGYLEMGKPAPDSNPQLAEIGYSIDNTTKTRAVFEINKGVNKHPEFSVNQKMDEEDRRIPFANMIYIADGPSDVPVFSIVNRSGGRTLGVYNPASKKEFQQVADLQEEGRIQGMGPADYRTGTQTAFWLERAVERVASRISDRREQTLRERVGTSPTHFVEKEEGRPGRDGGGTVAGDS